MELFNVSKFKEYEKYYPDFLFEWFQLSYGKYFDFMKLKSKLVYMYVVDASVECSFSTMKKIKKKKITRTKSN